MSFNYRSGLVLIIALLVAGSFTGISTAQSVNVSAPDDPVVATAGETVPVTFTVTNPSTEESTASVTVNNTSLPSSWTLANVSGSDPDPVDQFAVLTRGSEVVFSDIDPDETVTVTAMVTVPEDVSSGNEQLTASLYDGDDNSKLDTVEATIAVPQKLDLAADETQSVSAGEEITVSFTVTNDGSAVDTGVILVDTSTLPDSWSVSEVEGTDPDPIDQFAVLTRESEIVFSDIDPGETVTASVTVAVPETATPNTYELDADLRQDGEFTATAGVGVTVVESTGDEHKSVGNETTAIDVLEAVSQWQDDEITVDVVLETIEAYKA